ncbi:MAG: RNA polymerase factor sigma-54 [Candidatus Binatia bacterium]
MALETRLLQKLAQQLVMTPQLQQAIKLLQLSHIDLEDLISQELEENPALEETAPETEEGATDEQKKPDKTNELAASDKIGSVDWQDYLESHSNSIHGSLTAEAGREDGDGYPSWENTLTKTESLYDHLVWQLRLSDLDERAQTIGMYIIGNLDERGYVELPLEEVCRVIGATPEEAEPVLKRIQFFDPVGVASRNLRECLLVQLENLGLSDGLAARIVSGYLSELESRRYEKVARDLSITIDDVVTAAHLIATLEPKPARGFGEEQVRTIIPDVTVQKIGDEYMVLLNDEGVPHLRVSALYHRLSGAEGDEAAQARAYLEDKVRAATWLIKSIHWRQQTLYRVTHSIFKFQHDFLDDGVSQLKPMVLRDVAEDIGMHESTVSRATANKYVYTPQGLFELKYFFQSGLRRGNGEDVASESVREKIRNLISAEDPRKPYSDQDLARLLSQQTIDIARRTVAKYREAMGILPSSRRRQPYLRR